MGWPEKVARVPELIKLEYTVFVLPFTYIGMLFAGIPTVQQFILITLSLVCARGAAFSANRYFGLNYDLRNPKKSNWASVKLYSKSEMLAIFAALMAVFMGCAYLLNMLAFMLAPFVILLVILEPHAKKYTEHRHFVMGLVIGLGTLGGYIGVAGSFPISPALYVLLAGYALFSGGSDIIYALNHAEFDKENGLKTYPTKYGVKKSVDYSLYAHNLAALLFEAFGAIANSAVIVVGAFVAYLVLFVEHRQISPDSEKSLKTSFFYYNAAVSLIMLASVAAFKFL